MSDHAGDQQKTIPAQRSTHSFRKAFAFGAIWWIVVSLVASVHNQSRHPGIIFGELLVPTLIAAAIAGAAGRFARPRTVWLLTVAVFLISWFAIRLSLLLPHLAQ